RSCSSIRLQKNLRHVSWRRTETHQAPIVGNWIQVRVRTSCRTECEQDVTIERQNTRYKNSDRRNLETRHEHRGVHEWRDRDLALGDHEPHRVAINDIDSATQPCEVQTGEWSRNGHQTQLRCGCNRRKLKCTCEHIRVGQISYEIGQDEFLYDRRATIEHAQCWLHQGQIGRCC